MTITHVVMFEVCRDLSLFFILFFISKMAM